MTVGLVTYVMTAGLASDDYRFLGRAPKDTFWRRYGELTSFERPTALVLSKGETFRAYVSGVRSARRDRTKTPLRYTLVLEGACGSAGAELVVRALSAFLSDLAEAPGSPQKMGALGLALDEAFPEPFVESALGAMRDGGSTGAASAANAAAAGNTANTSGTTNAASAVHSVNTATEVENPLAEVEARVVSAFESLTVEAPRQRSDVRFFWGGRASAAARAQFLGHAERLLLEGESGAALAVNLASRDHLESLGGNESSCAVLFAGEDGEEVYSDPLEWPPKKGRPGSPKGLPRAIVLAREAQVEPGWSQRWGQLLRAAFQKGVFQTLRGWLMGRRESS